MDNKNQMIQFRGLSKSIGQKLSMIKFEFGTQSQFMNYDYYLNQTIRNK